MPDAAPRSDAMAQWRRLRPVIWAAVIGAASGVRLVRPGGFPSFSPGPLFAPMMISLGLWVVLSIYWEIAARNASAPASSESGASRALHLVMTNGAIILSYWPFAGWPNARWSSFEFPRILPATIWLPWAGVAVGAGGLVLALWARRHLGRHWSGAVTVKQGHELVRTGPYRLIRHPIYTGAIAMHAGTALITGRLQGPLAVALIVIAYIRKIGMEERVLGATFGAAFEAYRRESWALLPWIV